MSQRYELKDLEYLMDRLRDPVDGCPWDLDQTYRSIVASTIEEAYEVADAIEQDDFQSLAEELGDLLFQVIFYSRLAKEEGRFNFSEIVHQLVSKLVRRHPHVFPDGTLESRKHSTDQPSTESLESHQKIKASWEKIKEAERGAKGKHGVLDDVPLNLPALSRAQKLQKRAARVGFDWTDIDPVIEKIEEEIAELRVAIREQRRGSVEDEMGDLLFSCVNLARHLKLDAETTLRRGQGKFERRFRWMEEELQRQNRQFFDCGSEDLGTLWNRAKETVN